MAQPKVIKLRAPNSDKWLACTPEYIFEFHPGELHGKVLIYAAQIFSNVELREQADRFRTDPVLGNTYLTILKRVHGKICIDASVNPVTARPTWDKGRHENVKVGGRGGNTKTHKIKDLDPSAFSDPPTLQEVYKVGQQSAPPQWYITADEVFSRCTVTVEDIKKVWNHQSKSSQGTKNLIEGVKRYAKAIRVAKSEKTPVPSITLKAGNQEQIEDLKAVVEKMRAVYPPKAVRRGRRQQGSSAEGFLKNKKGGNYEIFLRRVKDLEEPVRGDANDFWLGCGDDIAEFFAGKEGGIHEGEDSTSIRKFKDFCQVELQEVREKIVFEDKRVLDRYVLALMRQAWVSKQKVRVGFLSYMHACLEHLVRLLSQEVEEGDVVGFDEMREDGVGDDEEDSDDDDEDDDDDDEDNERDGQSDGEEVAGEESETGDGGEMGSEGEDERQKSTHPSHGMSGPTLNPEGISELGLRIFSKVADEYARSNGSTLPSNNTATLGSNTIVAKHRAVAHNSGNGVKKGRTKKQGQFIDKKDYDIFSNRLNELTAAIEASKSTTGSAQPLFKSGNDVADFFTVKEGGIREGNTGDSQLTMREFATFCETELQQWVFDEFVWEDPCVLDRHILAIMLVGKRSEGKVKKGILRTLDGCLRKVVKEHAKVPTGTVLEWKGQDGNVVRGWGVEKARTEGQGEGVRSLQPKRIQASEGVGSGAAASLCGVAGTGGAKETRDLVEMSENDKPERNVEMGAGEAGEHHPALEALDDLMGNDAVSRNEMEMSAADRATWIERVGKE